MREAHEHDVELVKTKSHATEALHFLEQIFNQMPTFVFVPVKNPRLFRGFSRRNNHFGALLAQPVGQRVGVVAFVSQHGPRLKPVDKGLRLRAIVFLACRQDEFQGISQSVANRMDFRA